MWKKENLRKNFLRVKQIADQNLGRAEKSEVLSEDQQFSEKRVEVVRQVSNSLTKKVTALLEAPPGTDPEKRLKKMPETSLSHTLIESATLLGTDSLLGSVCQQCGECQGALAREELQCELDIERDVLLHLQNIGEVDIPSIMKQRKHLTKSTLDMDIAKKGLNSAVRQSQVPGANMSSAAAKADAVREEYEEACNKVEAIKDNLSIELCHFIAKESEHSSRLVALLEAQAAYHKKALRIIEDMLPKMKTTIEDSPAKPVFGMSLDEHLRVMGRDISLVLEACILTLLDIAMEEEGLFRLAGSALKLKKLKACFDAHTVDMEEFTTDPHTVAGVLKQYLRELPEPMLTFDLHADFMRAAQLPMEQRIQSLSSTVNKLPANNYNNFRYLVKFLALLAEKSQINKMTPSNIAIVMGPNLLWAKGETTPNMITAGAVSGIIETFIIHAEHFFPGEIDFRLTGRGRAPPSPSQLPAELWEESAAGGLADMNKVLSKQKMDSQDVDSTMISAFNKGLSQSKDKLDGEVRSEAAPTVSLSISSLTTSADTVVKGSPSPPNTLSLSQSATNLHSPTTLAAPPSSGGEIASLLKLRDAHPPPTSPTSPSQSVHQDMYTTVFALHSLGEGGAVWSDYLTRVRALWDGQFQSTSVPNLSSEGQSGPASSQSGSAFSQSISASSQSVSASSQLGSTPSGEGMAHLKPVTKSAELAPPLSVSPEERTLKVAPESMLATAGGSAERHGQGWTPGVKKGQGQEMDFVVSTGYSPESPATDGHRDSTPMMAPSHSSPPLMSQLPAASRGSPAPVVALGISPIGSAETLSPTADSREALQLSPKQERRVPRKPAPPPPPDRPHPATSASRGAGNVSSQTLPRGTKIAGSDGTPDSGATQGNGDQGSAEHRHSAQERSHAPPPERPHAPPPERPKPPVMPHPSQLQHPPGVPGGHQRSASTGTMYITTNPMPVTTPQDGVQGGLASGAGTMLTVGGASVPASGMSTLGRRPARPSPPPPPPPINQATENTQL